MHQSQGNTKTCYRFGYGVGCVPRLSLFYYFFLSSQTMAFDSTNIQSHKSYYSRQSSPKEKNYKANKKKKKKNHNFLRITRRLALEAFMAWDKSTKVETANFVCEAWFISR